MSAVNLPELVADLRQHHDRRPVRSAPSLAGDAADFIQQVIDALPAQTPSDCPTCDGARTVDRDTLLFGEKFPRICTDCTDGKLDVLRALARLAELEAIVLDQQIKLDHYLAWFGDDCRCFGGNEECPL